MSTYANIIGRLNSSKKAKAAPEPETFQEAASQAQQPEPGPAITQPTPQVQAPAVAGGVTTDNITNPLGGFYESAWRAINKGREPETEEQRLAREKRDKARGNIAALADGFMALANAFNVSRGAQAVETPSLSMANRQRYEYAKRLRKENEDAWRHGLFNARVQDVRDMRESQRLRDKMAIDAEEKAYKRGRDAIGDKKWEREFGARMENEATRNEQWEKKFEQDKKDQAEARKIQWANYAVNRDKALKGDEIKTDRYSFADGTNIEIPADLEENFYADAYNKLAEAMGEEGDKRVLDIFKKNLGAMGNVSPAAAKRATVKEFAREYPEVESFMREYADKLMCHYHGKQSEPVQTPGEVHVTRTPTSEDWSHYAVGNEFAPKQGWGVRR